MADTPPAVPSATRHRRRRRAAPSATAADATRIDWIEAAPPAVLLVVALLAGGSVDPIGDMAIRLVALIVLLVIVARASSADWRRLRPAWIVALATLAIAAIELVPLPYATWRGLPGHAPFADLLDALRLGGAARPLSLDPEATRATLIAVIPGLAAFAAALKAGRRSLDLWTLLVVAGAGVTALIGGFQVAGYRDFYFYEHSNIGQLTGVFANRNHAADLLLVGIALASARFAATGGAGREARIALGAFVALLAVSVLLTISRFGIVLLGAELIALALLLAPPRRRTRQGVVIAVLAIAAVLALIAYDPRIVGTFGRFGSLADDLRPELWRTTLYAARQYWPTGSGLGTFEPIYVTVEQLDTMPAAVVNHAHNEYLELVLELGVVGAVATLAYLVALGMAIVRAERRGGGIAYRVAALGVVVLLAHSTNEFPLRNAALLVVFGLLNGIVFAASQRGSSGGGGGFVSK